MSLKEKRNKKVKKEHSKKKLKSTNSSESDDDSEHELFYYANDRVQLMKEVLKVLKSKKIKSLAPDSIKNLDIEELNTMLLEELLGISNKRLKKVLDGQNADDESSSSDEDEANKVIDIISLDDISDDEDFCFVEESPNSKDKIDPKNDKSKNSKRRKVKKEPREKSVKTEKTKEEPKQSENEKLLSVLELLELQARARAIRSQLVLEAENKAKSNPEPTIVTNNISDDDEDAVIVQSPKTNEIVISSSESEAEKGDSQIEEQPETAKKSQKIRINRSRINNQKSVEEVESNNEKTLEPEADKDSEDTNSNENNADADKVIDESNICDIPLPAVERSESVKSIEDKESQSEVNENTEIVNGICSKDTSVAEMVDNVDNDKNDDRDVLHLDIVEIEDIDV